MFDDDTLELFELFRLDPCSFDFSEFLIRYNLILFKLHKLFEQKPADVNIHFFSWIVQGVSKVLESNFEAGTVSCESLTQYSMKYFFELQEKSRDCYDLVDLNFVYCFLISNIIRSYDLGNFYGPMAYQMFENFYRFDALCHSFDKEEPDGNLKKYTM